MTGKLLQLPNFFLQRHTFKKFFQFRCVYKQFSLIKVVKQSLIIPASPYASIVYIIAYFKNITRKNFIIASWQRPAGTPNGAVGLARR